jgi:hypothetical protein
VDQLRRAAVEDERTGRQVVEAGRVQSVHARHGVEALAVEPDVDRLGSALAVQVEPLRCEAVVVLAAALGARTVAGRERGRLVEEEELREASGTHERGAPPAAELEAARDPAPHLEMPPDTPLGVVEAAAVPVDEASGGVGDQLAERRHAVPERHPLER